MRIFHTFASFLLPFLLFTTCHQLQQPLNPNAPSQPRLRNATVDDADDIASVIIAAFSPTPAWQYIYQFLESKPKEHHRCVRSGIMQGFALPEYYGEVIEAPQNVKGELSVAAVAIWRRNLSLGAEDEDGTAMFMSRMASKYFTMRDDWDQLTGYIEQCEHRDMNLTRAIPFGHDSTVALRKYIEEPFGPTQLYLDLIAVHPEYQLHGAGTRLVSRGIEIGRKEGVNVTLAALPTSEGFYAHIGFYSDANFTLKSIDGDKEFRYDVMAYDFDAEE